MKHVESAGKTMQEVMGSIQRVGDIIGEITAASNEQSGGISQVNQAVGDIDRMTQQNAALVEESAAAAESLKDQAARLAEVVQQFKLEASATSMASYGALKISQNRTTPSLAEERNEPQALLS
ncbi:Methyl-accepting chemotaxis protein III [compost metagenome]